MNKNSQSQTLFEFITLVYEKISGPYTSSFRDVLSPLQYYTVCVIYYYKSISMSSLAESMKMPKQNMTKIIDKLIEMDFVKRFKDINDKRMVLISLTSTGHDFLVNHLRYNTDSLTSTLSTLCEDDTNAFFEALSQINNVMKKLPK